MMTHISEPTHLSMSSARSVSALDDAANATYPAEAGSRVLLPFPFERTVGRAGRWVSVGGRRSCVGGSGWLVESGDAWRLAGASLVG